MHNEKNDNRGAVWRDHRALALLLAATLTVMANATISPALAGLEDLFGDDENAEFLIRLLVPAPSISVVIFAPILGFLADRIGRRWLLLSGVVLFVVAGSAGFYLPNLMQILISRLVLGIAVAMIMTTQMALIGDYFVGEQRNSLMGLQTSARNFGGFVFIVLGGICAAISPRYPFAIYAIAGAYLPYIWVQIKEPSFTRAEMRLEHETLEKSDHAWIGFLSALVVLQMITNMVFFLMPTQLPFFLVVLGHDSATMTGATLGALALTGGVSALFYGGLKNWLGYAGTYALGFGLMGIGFSFLPFGSNVVVLLGSGMVIGAGFALVMPNFVSIALQISPTRHRGLAGGILTAAVFLGQFFSPFVSMPSIQVLGYEGTFWRTAILLGAICVVSAVSALKFDKTKA